MVVCRYPYNNAVSIADDIVFNRAGIRFRVGVNVCDRDLRSILVDTAVIGNVNFVKIYNVGGLVSDLTDRVTVLIKSYVINFTGPGSKSRRLP